MRKLLFLLIILASTITRADEGMWMLNNLPAQTVKRMQSLGLKLTPQQLYSTQNGSLKDAVVSFGGFCTGVVVSPEGLVFTNHHCGFESIQQQSSAEHDYIKNGFVSQSFEEELPIENLFVSFLVSTRNITAEMNEAIGNCKNEFMRQHIIDSISVIIQQKEVEHDSTLRAEISSYYQGNEFYINVYRDYTDIRLVFAPPASVGKFGGENDNWMWPRQTGDFSIFRIYADKDNKPAAYSKDNVPLKAKAYAPVSLDGYNEGSFCMTIGYPGETCRYLSSYGIKERMECLNQVLIDMRGVKQQIWRKHMDANPVVRIKYDSKYDISSNYWKNSIGMNNSIKELHIIEKKQALEKDLHEWIQSDSTHSEYYRNLLPILGKAYKKRKNDYRTLFLINEAFYEGSDLLGIVFTLLNTDFSNDNENLQQQIKSIADRYNNMDIDTDKEIFAAMLKEYAEQVNDNEAYLPECYKRIKNDFKGDYNAFADNIYAASNFSTIDGLRRLFSGTLKCDMSKDAASEICIDIMVKLFELQQNMAIATDIIDKNERLLNRSMRLMQSDRLFYSDANSTMRMSYGVVGGYEPKDAMVFGYYSTPRGIIEKFENLGPKKDGSGDMQYFVEPELMKLYKSNNFGRYADKKSGTMQLCFLTNNDITGGNSGSPMFNGKGELLGLAFDGNWEAMSSDITFEPNLQRCIGVDVRYILYLIEKWGNSPRLINELKISGETK